MIKDNSASKKALLEKINSLQSELFTPLGMNEDVVEDLEIILRNYLNRYPMDVEIWIKLALASLLIEDFYAAIESLDKAYEYNHKCEILLYKVIIQDIHCYISDETIAELNTHKFNNEKHIAIFYYTMGLYSLQNEDEGKALSHFKQAILLYPNFVRAFWNMARIYYNAGNTEKGLHCKKKALAGVKTVLTESTQSDHLSVDFFENESIFGTHLTAPTKSSIEEMPEILGHTNPN